MRLCDRASFVRRMSLAVVCGVVGLAASAAPADQWYKGNTHTHTWWSDGDSPPEVAVKWYKEHGYAFLVLSDHNVLSQGDKWVVADAKRTKGLAHYNEVFPNKPLPRRERDGKTEYRLTTLDELRATYQTPGGFLLVQGEEISDQFDPGKQTGGQSKKLPIHLNGFNLKELVPPQGGKSVTDTLQRNIDAVLAQRQATGQPMFPHINHPNFGWALTADDMAPLRGEQFFEVYNGHRGVRNYGDEQHPSTERMWDVVLTRRLADLKLPVMYGMATDDAHAHVDFPGGSNPGRGWVMVQATELTPEALVAAMERGDFYATTGVTLQCVQFKDNTLTVEIDPRSGVSYKTQFIGTRRGYDRKATTRPADDGRVMYEYSQDIGQVLAEQPGEKAGYKLTGDELYVRAKIISDAKHPNPFAEGDLETAWTQPVQPK